MFPEQEEPKLIALTRQWIIINKPAGWLTIPATPTLQDKRAAEAPVLSDWVRQVHGACWVVHRLDRETSGLVLFARAAEDHRTANLWFQGHQVKKLYYALASGNPASPIFKLSRKIRGQPATTQVEVRERFEGAFLSRVRPLSGRRHQIRIHLSEVGHPLLGDVLYGGPERFHAREGEMEIARVALHAFSLELPGGEKFEAPLPEDFERWLQCLRTGTREGMNP